MRRWAALALLLVAACASQEEAQLEQAVREHLTNKKHLNLTNIRLRLENVEIRDEEAFATVLYFIEDQTSPIMQYRYTFVRDDEVWYVLESESLIPSNGFAHPSPSEPSPPPGGDEAPPETTEEEAPELPPGHP
ncbi:MAG: hypothetical protein JSV08_08485 [Acidobacteriota bacterium]|nr:MAG: hypothetical protein JSV08_08485 [Acidobacteriota bacterium]